MPDDANSPPQAADDSGEVQFYIPATSSLLERRPRTLKCDDTFAMFDHYGDIFAGERTPEGLFHQDTRFLSRYQLTLNGRRPLLLGSSVQDDNALLSVDLTNADSQGEGRRGLRKDSIHLLRSRFIWQAACYERLAFHNFDRIEHELLVTLDFDADFFDLFQVRGERRARHGALDVATSGDDTVTFSYRGLDGLDRSTTLHFDPPPDELTPRQASLRLRLPPGGRRAIFVTIRCNHPEPGDKQPRRQFFHALRQARRPQRAAAPPQARIETSNAVFNEVLRRSAADLAMLTTATAYGPYPYAGIPWFSTAFGRDGILTAVQMLWVDPEMARGVLRYLARTQAQADDAAADAEPGKILHETRAGEMARLGEVPFGKYYGTIDATPLFVVLAGLYWQRTLDFATIEALWPNITAALAWLDANAARHPDGLIAYRRRRDGGLANQGWKDSEDSIFHADGRLAAPPIALAEVQGYAWHARVLAAKLARRKGEPVLAARLDEQAEELRRQVEARFWCEELGTYALAIDGDGEPCRIRTSNAGHLLWSGLPSRQRAAQVADLLLAPSMFSGWGCVPSPPARPATTRCPTTTARYGRTTTR
ncbi:MAG: glycogen debranching N-terminal domain-containing protein [Rhodospirillales bacterium]